MNNFVNSTSHSFYQQESYVKQTFYIISYRDTYMQLILKIMEQLPINLLFHLQFLINNLLIPNISQENHTTLKQVGQI